MALTHAEATWYAREAGLDPSRLLYALPVRLRGRHFTAETVLVFLPGYDQRDDRDEIEAQLGMIELTSVYSPYIVDQRIAVPDELLRDQAALALWLAS